MVYLCLDAYTAFGSKILSFFLAYRFFLSLLVPAVKAMSSHLCVIFALLGLFPGLSVQQG